MLIKEVWKMRITKNWLFAGALASCLGVTPGLAIQQEEPAPAEQPAPVEEQAAADESAEPITGLEIEGTLKGVDPDEQIFLVTSSTGEELLFHYDDQTEVVGQDGGVQGLSGAGETMLHIEYRAEGNRAIAERLEPAANAPDAAEEPAETAPAPEELPDSEDPGL
jgi:hypothetical protein